MILNMFNAPPEISRYAQSNHIKYQKWRIFPGSVREKRRKKKNKSLEVGERLNLSSLALKMEAGDHAKGCGKPLEVGNGPQLKASKETDTSVLQS